MRAHRASASRLGGGDPARVRRRTDGVPVLVFRRSASEHLLLEDDRLSCGAAHRTRPGGADGDRVADELPGLAGGADLVCLRAGPTRPVAARRSSVRSPPTACSSAETRGKRGAEPIGICARVMPIALRPARDGDARVVRPGGRLGPRRGTRSHRVRRDRRLRDRQPQSLHGPGIAGEADAAAAAVRRRRQRTDGSRRAGAARAHRREGASGGDWAGALPYFADRESIDLLGKTDPGHRPTSRCT